MKTLIELQDELNEAKINFWKNEYEKNKNELVFNTRIDLIKAQQTIYGLEKNLKESKEEIIKLKEK